MVFKRMLNAFGVGGPSVDTVLTNPNTRPGLTLDGTVQLRGGEMDAEIEQIAVALVTRVEVESGDSEFTAGVEFQRLPVTGPLKLAAGQQLAIPFRLPVPWETPITDVYGQRLRGMTMGLRTDVAIARAVDKGDLDPVAVHPLPVQERILDAFARLGFHFKNADLEHGRIYGVQQTLPFFQEIEFFAAPQYAGSIKEVELTFIANPHSVEVVLEADKRGGFFTPGHDAYGRHVVEHAGADQVDWTQRVDEWMRQLIAGYASHGHQWGGVPPAGYHGGAEYHGGHHGSSGVGGMVAGAALGFVGGMIAGELIEDAVEGAFEAFDGDE
ncbi:MAG TPA: sporulation protein [Micromonosporaceae bacterium]